jgi:nitrate/TMAO reductase-like tetraheme cytochrome c subunit
LDFSWCSRKLIFIVEEIIGIKRIMSALKLFFFPPANASLLVRTLPYAVLGVLSFGVLVAGAYGWEYTNSPEFCGTSCHTMPPEYNSYLVSPHARIECVECHIGRDFIATQITSKVGDIRHVIFTIFRNYEYPITANDMRPARETCERCHFPEKFSDDSFRQINAFTSDVDNTPYTIYLTLKTGGGSTRQGLGRGIHWHIENRILYYAQDTEEQVIPYVRVYQQDGTYIEYLDTESDLDPSQIQESELHEMDCITCHNRITHLVNTPEDSIDAALQQGLIDRRIPEIRKKSIEVLRVPYASNEEGLIGISGLRNYYQVVYPDFYSTHLQLIEDAIRVVQDIYTQSVHIEQRSDWNTHPNNIGHLNSPGCFRCHDGNHLTTDNEAIRLECNLCHSIPVVAGPYDFLSQIEISRGPEPQSHLSTTWIAQHYLAFNPACSNCHETSNPGGTDNTSFCSNSACHGTVWEFAGFDAPALRELVLSTLPPTPPPATIDLGGALTYQATIQPLFMARCGACHGDSGVQGLNLTEYASALSGGTNGPVILPGNPDSSPLIQRQSQDLPHFGQLNPEELLIVREWILNGAPEK